MVIQNVNAASEQSPENGPANTGPANTGPASAEPASAEPSTGSAIIAQATAVIAIASAIVYGAGGLSLGLRLWYDQYSWSPVLGQLPRTFMLLEAVSHVIPFALVLGILGYILRKRLSMKYGSTPSWKGLPTLLSLALAAVMGGVPLVFLHFVRKSTITGVIRPYWQIFLLCAAIAFAFIRIAWYLMPKTNVKGLQRILGVGVLAMATIPVVAASSAAYALPVVTVCGPAFRDVNKVGEHYAIGNLIGTSGQWIYIAETIAREPSPNKFVFIGGYIAVIPLSAVQLEGIGRNAGCGDLRAPTAPAT